MTPISRRRFVAFLGLAGLSATGVLAACSTPAPAAPTAALAPPKPSAAPATSAPSATAPVAGQPTTAAAPTAAAANAPDPSTLAAEQKLVSVVSNMPQSVDPHFVLGGTPRRFDMYEALVQYQPDGSVVPMLASAWQQVDPTTVQFTLRPDSRFHNGQQVTASDVKFSFERATRKDNPLATAGILNTFKAADTTDPMKVTIQLTQPDAQILKKIARLAILPEKYITGLGSDLTAQDKGFAEKPVGSGPFQFVEYAAREKLVLKRFDGHQWRKAFLTDLTIRQVAEPAAQKAAFLSGDAHYINLIPLDAVPQMQSMGATLIVVTKGNSLGAYMDPVDSNGTPKTGPMGNPKVRQALNYGVDKDTLVKAVLGGLTQPESGQIPSHDTYGFDPTIKPYPYDRDKALQMLDEAGYPSAGGSRFSITMASAFAAPGTIRRDMGEYVQGQLQKLGITVDFTPISDVAVATDMFYNRKPRPDIYHFGLFTRPSMDPAGAYNWFRGDNSATHYKNPEFDRLFQQSDQELDSAKREGLLKQLTKILHDDAPWLFLTEDLWIDAAAPKLKGTIVHDAEVDQIYDRLYFVK